MTDEKCVLKEEDFEKEIQEYIEQKKLSDAGFLVPSIARHFVEWQKRKLIDKFNEWCQEEFYIHPHDCHVVQYVSDKPLEDIDDFIEEFEKKMNE